MSKDSERTQEEATAETGKRGHDRKPGEGDEGAREDGKHGKISDASNRPREVGGPKGPEPTRYGDWEKNGRCIDF